MPPILKNAMRLEEIQHNNGKIIGKFRMRIVNKSKFAPKNDTQSSKISFKDDFSSECLSPVNNKMIKLAHRDILNQFSDQPINTR